MFTGGLASGIDTGALIQQLTRIERQPIVEMQTQQRNFRTQISQLGAVKSKMSELEGVLSEVIDNNSVVSSTATSSDEDVVGIQAEGQAARGSWDIDVLSVARAERSRSDAFDSAQSEVRAGTLSLEVWGEDAVDVTIEEGATLAEVREAINSSGAKVKASIITTGSGSRLSIESEKTGYDPDGAGGVISSQPADMSDALKITESYTLGGAPVFSGQVLGLTETQQAKNSEAVIDGLSVVSTSKTLDDVFDGVRIELKGETSQTETISIAADESGTVESVQSILDQVNGLFRELRAFDGASRSIGRRAKSDMQFAISSLQVAGNGEYNNLSAIGITTNFETGDLELNETKLQEALDQDPASLSNLFTDETSGLAAKLGGVLERYVDDSLDANVDGLENRIERLDDRILRKESSVERYASRLQFEFSQMERLISQFQDSSNSFAGFLPVQPG